MIDIFKDELTVLLYVFFFSEALSYELCPDLRTWKNIARVGAVQAWNIYSHTATNVLRAALADAASGTPGSKRLLRWYCPSNLRMTGQVRPPGLVTVVRYSRTAIATRLSFEM